MGGSQPIQQKSYSLEVPDSKKPGSSSIFIHPNARAYLYSKCHSGDTLYESFLYASTHFPDNNFLGTRASVPEGFGKYEWITYRQAKERSQKLGWGLSQLGVSTKDENGHAFLGVYSKNRLEWVLMDHACISQDITTVPIYDTLQADAFEYIVDQTKMRAVACNVKGTETILKLKESGELKTIHIVIQFEDVSVEILERSQKLGVKIMSILEVENLAKTGSDIPPSPESIVTICYTSGTTGRAKGAMITHRNMISTMSGLHDIGYHFEPNDVYLSYLPLAHMMERMILHHLSSYGVSIGFYQGEVLKLKEDLAELKPTIFVSVPRLFNRFHDLISQQLAELTGPKRLLATRALDAKNYYYRTTGALTHKLWDSLVFKKIQNVLGGRVRIMLTGSAPIAADVLNFLKVVFSCQIVEGYGQTETCGATFLTSKTENKAGIVGGPTSTNEFKLAEVPDMDYLSTDVDEQGNPTPRGEVCVRGPTVFKGYYKSRDLTSEAIDEEGWLHTGDIGVRNFNDGSLKLIDRKKNFFKLQQGEYVSAEKIEMAYLKSYFVAQIFVYGDSLQNYLIAVVVPDEAYIRKKWAKENGFSEDSNFEAICSSEKLKKDILADMDKKGKEEKLLGFEVVKKILLEPKVWTPDDILTPTQKLMRFKAKNKYESEIKQLYSEP